MQSEKTIRSYVFLNIVLIVLLIKGCANISDPAFHPYLVNFIEEAAKRGVDVNSEVVINFGEVKAGKSGSSRRTILGQRVITISERQWRLQNENERTFLIYHELGHALLNRPHENSLLATGQCASMMHEGVDIDCICDKYSDVWVEFYLDELFLNDAKNPLLQYQQFELDSILFQESNNKHFTPGYEQWGYEGKWNELDKYPYAEIRIRYGELPNLRIEQTILEWNGIKVTYDPIISKDLVLASNESEKLSTFYRLHMPAITFPLDFRFIRDQSMVYCVLNGTTVHVLDYSLFSLNSKIKTAEGMSEYEYEIEIRYAKRQP